MKKNLLIILALSTTETFACLCDFNGDFLETIKDKETKLVIGQFIGHNDDQF